MSVQFVVHCDVVANPSARLAEAIRDDSNREMEWLWIASLMTDENEYEYCLRRALYINPHNRVIQRELDRIRVRSMSRKHLSHSRPNFFARGIQRLLNARWVKQYRWSVE